MSRHPVLLATCVGLILIIGLGAIYTGVSGQLEVEAKQREEALAKARRDSIEAAEQARRDSIAAELKRIESQKTAEAEARRKAILRRMGVTEIGVVDLDIANTIVNESQFHSLEEKTTAYNEYVKGNRFRFQASVSIYTKTFLFFETERTAVANFRHPFIYDQGYSGIELNLRQGVVGNGFTYQFECQYANYLSLASGGSDRVNLLSTVSGCKMLR